MAYKVVHQFADKLDNDHIYFVGDTYPRTGKKVSAERLGSLKSENNAIGIALVKEVKKATKKAE